MKILLDAGHGGEATGAIVDGVKEKDIALYIVLAMGKVLERLLPFANISYIRIQDKTVSLYRRHEIIKELQPDAFISVHCNACVSFNTRGFEIFYRNHIDLPLAESIHRVVNRSDLYTSHGGVKHNRGIKQDEEWLGKKLCVLNTLEVPSCLVEVGFLSNKEEREMIIHNISGIADLLSHGIINYFER